MHTFRTLYIKHVRAQPGPGLVKLGVLVLTRSHDTFDDADVDLVTWITVLLGQVSVPIAVHGMFRHSHVCVIRTYASFARVRHSHVCVTFFVC